MPPNPAARSPLSVMIKSFCILIFGYHMAIFVLAAIHSHNPTSQSAKLLKLCYRRVARQTSP